MRRDGGGRWIPRSPWPMPRGSFTVLSPLTGSRIEIPITRMIDVGLPGQKIVDDSATVSNIDVSFTYFVECNGWPFLASIVFSWILRRIRDCQRRPPPPCGGNLPKGCSFRKTTTIKQCTNTRFSLTKLQIFL